MPERASHSAERQKMITARISLLTLLVIGTLAASPAIAQESDAGAPAAIGAPVGAGSEKAAETPGTASEVLAKEGEGETSESGAGGQGTAEFGGELIKAVKAGKWLAAVGFALLLIVGAARRFGGKWAKTKPGGYALGFGAPMLGALGLSLIQGAWSIDLFVGAFTAGLAASGIYTAARDAQKSRAARVES